MLDRHKASTVIILFAFSIVTGLGTYAVLDYFDLTNRAAAQSQQSQEQYDTAISQYNATKAARRQAALTDYNSTLIVINKKHCFQPKSWQPSDLTTIEGGMSLRQEAAQQFLSMRSAATAAGTPFAPTSAYRSYTEQLSTYNYWVENSSQEEAETSSARAGCSEHQTGLAVDLKVGSCVLACFADTSAYEWLTRHGADYGFIQRYQEGFSDTTGYIAEPWHWRYVGVETAQDIKRRNIHTLEEYFDIEGGDYQ